MALHKTFKHRPYTLTWQEAAREIDAADDPELFEMGCAVAYEALTTGVPRQNIDAMIAEIDKLPKYAAKFAADGEIYLHVDFGKVMQIIRAYTKAGGNNEEQNDS